MGSKTSKPSTTSTPTYQQIGDHGLGHAQIATGIPGRKGKPPEVVLLRQNDEGKYVYDQEYYDQMEELARNNGAGVWDKRPEGHRGIGNIDVRMREGREDRGGEQGRQGRERDNRARGQQGEERVPAGLRGDMGGQRVYAPAGDGGEKEGVGKRRRAPRGNVHVDNKRQAFVRRKK